LQPLRDRLAAALQAPDADLINALRSASSDIPSLLKPIADVSQTERALEGALTAALFNGFAEAAASRDNPKDTTP
jgi:hypothetical protein